MLGFGRKPQVPASGGRGKSKREEEEQNPPAAPAVHKVAKLTAYVPVQPTGVRRKRAVVKQKTRKTQVELEESRRKRVSDFFCDRNILECLFGTPECVVMVKTSGKLGVLAHIVVRKAKSINVAELNMFIRQKTASGVRIRELRMFPARMAEKEDIEFVEDSHVVFEIFHHDQFETLHMPPGAPETCLVPLDSLDAPVLSYRRSEKKEKSNMRSARRRPEGQIVVSVDVASSRDVDAILASNPSKFAFPAAFPYAGQKPLCFTNHVRHVKEIKESEKDKQAARGKIHYEPEVVLPDEELAFIETFSEFIGATGAKSGVICKAIVRNLTSEEFYQGPVNCFVATIKGWEFIEWDALTQAIMVRPNSFIDGKINLETAEIVIEWTPSSQRPSATHSVGWRSERPNAKKRMQRVDFSVQGNFSVIDLPEVQS